MSTSKRPSAAKIALSDLEGDSPFAVDEDIDPPPDEDSELLASESKTRRREPNLEPGSIFDDCEDEGSDEEEDEDGC